MLPKTRLSVLGRIAFCSRSSFIFLDAKRDSSHSIHDESPCFGAIDVHAQIFGVSVLTEYHSEGESPTSAFHNEG